ncbi:MAG: hypothetical protein IIC71_10795 [Acidobacteria bacterium]|nr:hypothetical protein [Acidobacteriota bacterium]
MNHFGKYLAVIGVLTVGLLSGVAATSTQAVAELPRPMDAYVGFRHNPELEIAIFNNEETRRQASIQECMQRLGLEYEVVPADFNTFASNNQDARFYGLVDPLSRRNQERVIEIQEDPNIVYARSLGGVDESSYFEALFGEGWESEDPDTDAYNASCTGEAYLTIPGLSAEVTELRAAYDEGLRSEFETNEEVRSAVTGWVSCVGAAGVSAAEPGDMMALVDDAVSAAQLDDGMIDRDEINQLSDLEERLFAIDQNCNRDLRVASADAITRFERAFIASNAADLETYRAEKWQR